MENKYPISLSGAWEAACLKLWDLCYKYDVDIENITLWDAFKLLYLESVPDNLHAGRKSRGVFNDTTD